MKVKAAIESHHSISLRDSWPAILPGSISRACSRVRKNSEAVIRLCFLLILEFPSVRQTKWDRLSPTLRGAGPQPGRGSSSHARPAEHRNFAGGFGGRVAPEKSERFQKTVN